jgi:hypothetical protein
MKSINKDLKPATTDIPVMIKNINDIDMIKMHIIGSGFILLAIPTSPLKRERTYLNPSLHPDT